MINYILIKNVLIMSVINSIIITNLVQKFKESLIIRQSNIYPFISLGTALVVGTLFSFTFSTLNFITSLWSGLLSFIIADSLYKILEDKIYMSLKNIKCKEENVK